MKVRQLFYVLIVFCLIGITLDSMPQPAFAQQCDYYASPDGRGNGLSETSPFQIGNFLSMPESEMWGKTLCLLDGTYNQTINISSKSGTASGPITIRALNDNQVTLKNSGTSVSISNSNYLTIQGITIKGGNQGVYVTGSKHITLRRVNVFETVSSAIYFNNNNDDFLITECVVQLWPDRASVQNTGDNGWGIRLYDYDGPGTGKGVVEKCSIKYGWRAGLHVKKVMVDFLYNVVEGWGGDGERDHGMYYGNPSPVYSEGETSIVEGNIFINNHGYGLKISKWYEPANIIIRNNIFANNLVGGLIITFGVDGVKAYNNVFYENSGNNLQLNAYNYTSGRFNKNIKIKNNLFYSTTGNLVLLMDDAIEGLEIDYNCYYSTASTKFRTRINPSNYTSYSSFSAWQNNNVANWVDEHSIFQNPAMMDPAQGDYTLQPDSPCIDKGTPLLEVPYDFNYVPRPQGDGYDIGAYEYGGAGLLSAHANASPTSGQVPLSVNFTGTASGGTPLYSYSWDFADGEPSNEQNLTHIFHTPGTYTVLLSVADSDGNQANDSISISVTGSSKEDINLDGKLNSLDVQLCVNVLTGRETIADIVKRADVNGDGKVDSSDLQQIVMKLLGG